MKTFLSLFLLASATSVPLLLDSSLKGIPLLVIAGIIVYAFRRSSASLRHLLWTSALASLLLLPLLSLTLPKWNILPSAKSAEPASVFTPERLELPPSSVPVSFDELPSTFVATPSPVVPATTPEAAVAAAPLMPLAFRDWCFAVWALGAFFFLFRLGFSSLLTERRKKFTKESNNQIQATANQLAHEFGIHRRVRIQLGQSKSMPMTSGILRPFLRLPVEATTWDPSHLRTVLLHELAHVKRHDVLTQFLVKLTCAIYWFNPLVWFVSRRIELEREKACDDLVLANGIQPVDYAESLLQIVSQTQPELSNPAGLAMARPTTLETRMKAILTQHLNRRRLSKKACFLVTLLGITLALPIAMLASAQAETEPPEAASSQTADQDDQLDSPPSEKPVNFDFASSDDRNLDAIKVRTQFVEITQATDIEGELSDSDKRKEGLTTFLELVGRALIQKESELTVNSKSIIHSITYQVIGILLVDEAVELNLTPAQLKDISLAKEALSTEAKSYLAELDGQIAALIVADNPYILSSIAQSNPSRTSQTTKKEKNPESNSPTKVARLTNAQKSAYAELERELNELPLNDDKQLVGGVVRIANTDQEESTQDEEAALRKEESSDKTKRKKMASEKTLVPEFSAYKMIQKRISMNKRQVEALSQIYSREHPEIVNIEQQMKLDENLLKDIQLKQAALEAGAPENLLQTINPLIDGSGIGVVLNMGKDGFPFIERLLPGRPAEKHLNKGDRILSFRNSDLSSWVDLQHLKLELIVRALRGPAGDPIELMVSENNAPPYKLLLKRYQLPASDSTKDAFPFDLHSPEAMKKLVDNEAFKTLAMEVQKAAWAGDHARELEAIDKILETTPEALNYLFRKATILESMGRYDQAIECYQSYLSQAPREENNLYKVALGKVQAEKKNKTVEPIPPLDANSRKTVKKLLDEAGGARFIDDPAKELLKLEEALQLAPNDRGAIFQKAEILELIGRKKESIIYYQQVVEQGPKKGSNLYQCALAKIQANEENKAEAPPKPQQKEPVAPDEQQVAANKPTIITKSLKFVEAEATAKKLNGMKVLADEIEFDARTNTLILKGDSKIIASVEMIATALDRPDQNQEIVVRTNLIHANAEEMAEKLRLLDFVSISIVPDKKTNSLLIKGTPTSVLTLKKLLSELDVQRADDEATVKESIQERLLQVEMKISSLKERGLGKQHPETIATEAIFETLQKHPNIRNDEYYRLLDEKIVSLQADNAGLKASGLSHRHPNIRRVQAQIDAAVKLKGNRSNVPKAVQQSEESTSRIPSHVDKSSPAKDAAAADELEALQKLPKIRNAERDRILDEEILSLQTDLSRLRIRNGQDHPVVRDLEKQLSTAKER